MRYRDAGSRGVAAVLRRRQDTGDEEPRVTETIITGVYLHAERRFVPLSPARRRVHHDGSCAECLESTILLMAPEATHTLSVRSGWVPNHGISAPALSLYRQLETAPAGRRRVTDPDYEQIFEFEACIAGPGVRFRVRNPDGWLRWNKMPRSATLPEQAEHCIRVTDSESDSVQLTGIATGFSVAEGTLVTPAGSTPLSGQTGPGPDSIVVHSSGSPVVLVSHTTRRDRTRHLVRQVDVQSGDTRTLSEGDGVASVRLGADDALYVQRLGDETLRVVRYDLAGGDAEATIEDLRLF